jgi:hypothetical protein
MEPPLFPIVFWCNAPEAGLIGAVSLFKFRRIKHLIVAAITELVVRRALPTKSLSPASLERSIAGCCLYDAVTAEGDLERHGVRPGSRRFGAKPDKKIVDRSSGEP